MLTNIRWQQHLIPLGYELVANAVRIPEIDKSYLHTVYSKNPTRFKNASMKVSAAIRQYVTDTSNPELVYDKKFEDVAEEVDEKELEDL